MKIKIFLDGANLQDIESNIHKVDGLTTNPSLMRKAGITSYQEFAKEVLARAEGKPVSFEVLADDFDGIERQAHQIAEWGPMVYPKVPIMLGNGESTVPLLAKLSQAGIRVNVTAVMTEQQAVEAWVNMPGGHGIVSIFAGRIADTGVNPEPIIKRVHEVTTPNATILWASAREVFNVVQAERSGASIITLGPDLLAKLSMFGKDLTAYSQETVKQFLKDGEGIQF